MISLYQKIRLILEYLTTNNQIMEGEINELNILKDKIEKMQNCNRQKMKKNTKIESKEKMIEELKIKINEEKI